MLTFLSLFAGIGGFELGFERAGMACKRQVEIDDNCNAILAYHWPGVERLKDVRDVGRHNLETVDLVCGGFPCQDVSVAGRREGLDGERSGLWFEFIRVVEELKPKWVVVENVPGLLSSNDKRDFAAVLSGLGKRGYWWAYRVFNAEYWRVPHRRRRVFVVGCLRKGCAQEVLFERQSSPWDTPPSREAGQELARDVAASLRNAGKGHRGWTGDNEQGLTIYAFSQESDSSTVRNACDLARPIIGRHGNPGVVALCAPITGALDGHSGGPDDNDAQSGRLIPVAFDRYNGTVSGVCPTLPSSYEGGFNHVMVGIRRLMPVECERLQGFPDGWTAVDGMSDSARYRMLGNAVCVPVAEWIGRRIVKVEFAS